MNVNINISPKKKILKKIIILIFFSLLCFLINEKVFALSVPDFLTKYENDRVICNSDDGICLDDDSHTFKAFMEYYGITMHPYVFLTYNNDGSNPIILLFSELPYFECNSGTCNIYSSPTTNKKFSKFIYIARTGGPTADGWYYWNSYLLSTDESISYDYNFWFFTSNFNNYESNFDIKNLDDEIIYSSTSSGTVDWNDSEDIPSEDGRNWFEKVIDTIIDAFYNIGKFITDSTDNIINGISKLLDNLVESIKNLFVPGDELEGFFEEEYAYLKKQLGFLIYPIEVVVDFADRVYKMNNNTSAIFNIPKLKVFDHTLYEGTSFDLITLVNGNESIKYIYSIYRIAVSGFIVLWLVQLAIKKEKEIFGGGTE